MNIVNDDGVMKYSLLRPGNMYEGRCFYKFVHGRFGGEEKIGHKFTFLVIEEPHKYSIKIVC